jgi:hypothetical protein
VKRQWCKIALMVMMYPIMTATLLCSPSDASSAPGAISDSSGIAISNARSLTRISLSPISPRKLIAASGQHFRSTSLNDARGDVV